MTNIDLGYTCFQLLVTSLGKLKPKVLNNHQQQQQQQQQQQHQQQQQQHSSRQSSIIYNESALTLEKLYILKAWAEVYAASMKNETSVKTNFISSNSNQNTSDVTTHKDDKEESQDEDFGDFESTRYAK